jgi:hypothetical protein
MDQNNGQISVPMAAGVLVLAALGALVALSFLFKGNVHF